jgi:hypothetical protein
MSARIITIVIFTLGLDRFLKPVWPQDGESFSLEYSMLYYVILC